MIDLNEQVLEVRYKPNPKVLDYRGSWAEAISSYMNLSEWRILENRVDFFDKDVSTFAFVGFKNSGFVAYNTQTKNYFSDKAVKYFKHLFTLTGFGTNLFVERIGVRSRFCNEYNGSFDELREKYISNYLTLTEKAKKMIDAKLIDIGGPLNFKDEHGNFNTMSGPMVKSQISQFFEKAKTIPEVGLYVDIDYWVEPKKELSGSEVVDHISQLAASSLERYMGISNLILGK